MPRLGILVLSATTLALMSISVDAYAQYYGPPPSYGYPRPPCQAVTPGPLQGAGKGAAGGALIGAISGNAGRGAAMGAASGPSVVQCDAVRPAVRVSAIERNDAGSDSAIMPKRLDRGDNDENENLWPFC
jgi:hypothetical protein